MPSISPFSGFASPPEYVPIFPSSYLVILFKCMSIMITVQSPSLAKSTLGWLLPGRWRGIQRSKKAEALSTITSITHDNSISACSSLAVVF